MTDTAFSRQQPVTFVVARLAPPLCGSRWRAATRVDPTFADAWYNLGDLLDEEGRSEAATECLRTALRVAPDYADAMFNLALLLQRKNH